MHVLMWKSWCRVEKEICDACVTVRYRLVVVDIEQDQQVPSNQRARWQENHDLINKNNKFQRFQQARFQLWGLLFERSKLAGDHQLSRIFGGYLRAFHHAIALF